MSNGMDDAVAGASDSRSVWGRRERAGDEFHVPVTTYQTPSALVSRRLLAYDRDVHLMPLIYTYSKQVRFLFHIMGRYYICTRRIWRLVKGSC
jgi:hypothetical protein